MTKEIIVDMIRKAQFSLNSAKVKGPRYAWINGYILKYNKNTEDWDVIDTYE